MAKDPFMEGFDKGEAYANATVDTIFDGIKSKHFVGGQKKDAEQRVLHEFSGFFAAMGGNLLFRAHQMIEGMLVATKNEPNEADLWAQKVFTLFVEALQKEKVPVECKFIISRKKKDKPS